MTTTGDVFRSMSERHGWDFRAGQTQMASAVDRALASERHLLVEAGTGTGKTFAYLVPAILSGKRVVISTATKTLQDQVFNKDLPRLREILKPLGVTFRASLMKGLTNYLCRRRLDAARQEVGASKLFDVVDWLQRTEFGELSEVSTLPEESPEWRKVQSSPETRIGANCRYYDECFVTLMKRRAEESEIIVVNHHLFFADLALRTGTAGEYAAVIPAYDAVIFDEAHQLESIAGDFFGQSISSTRVLAVVRDARKRQLLKSTVDILEETGQRFFDELQIQGGRDKPLRREDFDGRLSTLFEKMRSALIVLSESKGQSDDSVLLARRSEKLLADLEAAVAASDHERITWVDRSDRSVTLRSSPVNIGTTLRTLLFDRVPTVVCTSATLATPSAEVTPDFSYVRERLGVPSGTDDLLVESPFDFRKQCILYVPNDLPDPSHPEYERLSAERTSELIRHSGGGALVLATSIRSMNALAKALRRDGHREVLLQGDAPKSILLDRFRAAGSTILVATMSFWEGVDVPGDALRLVVIDRIPFAVPTDPLVVARAKRVEEAGGNSFMQYHVPHAAISLKQGFGRLIRAASDRGMVAILDGRLLRKGYGKALLSVLPPAQRVIEKEAAFAFWENRKMVDPHASDSAADRISIP